MVLRKCTVENGPIVESFVYDGEHILLSFEGEENQTHRYLHGPEIDWILADSRAEGQVSWALGDHQGTIRDVINSQGVIQNHISYDSFGNVTDQTNPNLDFRFGYTGREVDEETGLYYYRARYYDGQIGRFISEDPIGFDGGDTNLYRYVGNSPTNAKDPFGEFALPLLVVPAAAIVLTGIGILYALDQINRNLDSLSDSWDIDINPDPDLDPNNINQDSVPVPIPEPIPGSPNVPDPNFDPNIINHPWPGDRPFKPLDTDIPPFPLGDDAGLDNYCFEASDYPPGFTDKVGQIAKETGRTVKEINDAIHRVKNKGLQRSGLRKNPDIVVEIETGDVFPKLPDGSIAEDSIGNIYDSLD